MDDHHSSYGDNDTFEMIKKMLEQNNAQNAQNAQAIGDWWNGTNGKDGFGKQTSDFLLGTGDKPGLLGGTRTVGTPYAPKESSFGIPNYAGQEQELAGHADVSRTRNLLNMGDANQMRGVQSDLIQQLQKQARGEGPSLAQMQLQRGTDQNIAQMMGAAASARGPGQAAQQKSAMMQGAQAQQQMAGDSGMLRLQEQMQAQNMLGNVSGQARAQDISSQGLNLEQQKMNDDLVKFYTQSGLSLEQAQQQAKQALEELRVKQQIEFEKMKNEAYINGGYGKSVGGMMAMLGSM